MHRRKMVVSLVGLLAASLVTVGCGDGGVSADDGGLIACTAIDGSGIPTGDLLVLDETGSTLRTISLGQSSIPAAFGAGPWVLYRSAVGDDLWLVGLAEGTTVSAGTRTPNWTTSPAGHRFAAAESFPDARGDKSITMYGFATGTITDLGAVLDPQEPTVVAWMDADAADANLLIWDSSGPAWVVPTSDPGDAWNLGAGSVAGDLSDDGTRVVFRDRTGDVYVGSLADRSTRLLVANPGFATPQFVTGDRILLQTTTGLLLIEPDGSQRVLWETPDEVFPLSRPWVAPDGTSALVGFGTSEPTWLYVSLPDGAVSPLDLGQMRVLTATPGYVTLAETREAVTPMVDALAVVDLADGSVSFATLPSDGVQPAGIASPTGDALVLTGASGVYVADLATGSLSALGSEVRAARFSSDGTRLVLDVWDGSDHGSGDIAIVPIDDPSAPEAIGAHCIQPVWVPSQ